MDDNRRKIIDKVVKLLALANGGATTAEAQSAKDMAATLMAKHNIAASEAVASEVFETYQEYGSSKKVKDHDLLLAMNVGKFNGVFVLYCDGYQTKGYIQYYGKTSHIEATKYMVGILVEQRKAAWERHLDEFGWEKGTSKERFFVGFARGVDRKLQELTQMAGKKYEEWGLVPVDDAKEAEVDYKKNNKTIEGSWGSLIQMRAGFEAGRNASIHLGMEKSSNDRKQLN